MREPQPKVFLLNLEAAHCVLAPCLGLLPKTLSQSHL